LQSTYGDAWEFETGSRTAPRLVCCDGREYRLDDQNVCFYMRSHKCTEDSRQIAAFAVLREMLFDIAHPSGNFLESPMDAAFDNCKPNIHVLNRRFCTPPTNVTNVAYVNGRDMATYVCKSISNVRTQVVAADDPRLRHPSCGRYDVPVQLQRKIEGRDLKVVFYRKRCGDWLILPTVVTSNGSTLDYRFADSIEVIVDDCGVDWTHFAEDVYREVGSLFFDADFRVDGSGRLHYLETNFSPAQVSAEDAIAGYGRQFTKSMLLDWLKVES
jgi:hypothetical protein